MRHICNHILKYNFNTRPISYSRICYFQIYVFGQQIKKKTVSSHIGKTKEIDFNSLCLSWNKIPALWEVLKDLDFPGSSQIKLYDSSIAYVSALQEKTNILLSRKSGCVPVVRQLCQLK